MVAFKEEFPYLRAESGQLFEFNRDWLQAAITPGGGPNAGYPSWWLTDHVTESITFYLRLRTDESVVAFSQLSQTVRYVLKVIGYKEIVPHFQADAAADFDLAFRNRRSRGRRLRAGVFRSARKTRRRARATGATSYIFSGCSRRSNICAARKTWTRSCDALREEVDLFHPGKNLTAARTAQELICSIR